MSEQFTEAEFRILLEKFIHRAGSQKLAARDLHISQQQLCDVMKGRSAPTVRIAAELGFTRTFLYIKREEHNS